jgi:hypothetical protein
LTILFRLLHDGNPLHKEDFELFGKKECHFPIHDINAKETYNGFYLKSHKVRLPHILKIKQNRKVVNEIEEFYCKVHEIVKCDNGAILAKINLWSYSTGKDITQCPILKQYGTQIQWIPFENNTIEIEHIMIVPHLKKKRFILSQYIYKKILK